MFTILKIFVYCITIILIFTLFTFSARFICKKNETGLEVFMDDSKEDAFGNRLKERKYIKYNGKRYYLDKDVRVYKVFDEVFVTIDNKTIKIDM